MPRTTRDETRTRLNHAVIAEAVEKGLSQVNVAGVVARAGVSAGTIYVHFRNKDDMLRQVYMQTKTEFHDRIMQARDIPDSAAMIRRMWDEMFAFVRTRPQDILFLEQGATARILTPEQQRVTEGFGADIAALLQRGVQDGTLADLDSATLSLLLTAPAMQLARGAVLSGRDIDPETVGRVFDRVWLSIAR